MVREFFAYFFEHTTLGRVLASIMLVGTGWIFGKRPEGPDLEHEGWYWTDDWQRAEKAADADLGAGLYADMRDVRLLMSVLRHEHTDPLIDALRKAGPRP